jgi:hypothetical protein
MSETRRNLAFIVPDDVDDRRLQNVWALVTSESEFLQSQLTTPSDDKTRQRYFPSFPCPVVVSRSMWRAWTELSPFDGVAYAATGRILCGVGREQALPPSPGALRRDAEVQYAAFLPLRNNWRPLGRSLPPALYADMLNHVEGYASVFGGRIQSHPVSRSFSSAVEGYTAVTGALERLHAVLES